MSQQNVELAEAFFVAWNARDADGVERLLHPDAKITRLSDRAGFPQPSWGARTSEYFNHLDDAWAALSVQISEYRDCGDSVVALGRMSGSGRGGGVELDRPFATVFTVRAGRFSRVDSFGNWDDALEAVGLGA
jgi:ketosteroid isomerase-like protein